MSCADVGVVHEVVVVADDRLAVPARRCPRCTVVNSRKTLREPDDEARRLAPVLQVLRLEAERRVGKDPVLLAEDRRPWIEAWAPTAVRAPSTTPVADDRVRPDRRRPRPRPRPAATTARGMDRDAVTGGPPGPRAARPRRTASPSTGAVARHLQTRVFSGHDLAPRSAADRPGRRGGGTCSGRRPTGTAASSPCPGRTPSSATPADLRHRLEDQHARHHRVAREVALEELLVEGDVLDADDALARLELEDPVHEQERVAVRQDLQDFADSDLQRRHKCSSGPYQATRNPVIRQTRWHSNSYVPSNGNSE